MHSKIIQIEKKPVRKEAYVEEDFFYGDGEASLFIGDVADYVCEMEAEAREVAVKSFFEALKKMPKAFEIDEENECFIIKDKTKALESDYLAWKTAIENCAKWSLEEFVNDTDLDFYQAKANYADHFGLYVIQNGRYPAEWNNFVRSAKEGVCYYVGACLDYHF